MMRLDKCLSNLKYGTRTDVKKMIKSKRIKVNNHIVTDPSKYVEPNIDSIFVDQERVRYHQNIVYMMNKPKGYVCANKDKWHKTVFDLLKKDDQRYNLSIAGRLDIDTEGLIILTNNGALVHDIISPNKSVDKIYEVTTELPLDEPKRLLEPMVLLDGKKERYVPKRPNIIRADKNVVVISIQEGKFHQVKRMFEAIGHKVINLKRLAINQLALEETLELGTYRKLTNTEIDKLVSK